MRPYMTGVAAALMLVSSGAWAQSATSHVASSTKTTTNGKVTSAHATSKTATCRNEKKQFIKCSSATKVSTTATVTKGSDGKCRFAAGPKKGQFTKCP